MSGLQYYNISMTCDWRRIQWVQMDVAIFGLFYRWFFIRVFCGVVDSMMIRWPPIFRSWMVLKLRNLYLMFIGSTDGRVIWRQLHLIVFGQTHLMDFLFVAQSLQMEFLFLSYFQVMELKEEKGVWNWSVWIGLPINVRTGCLSLFLTSRSLSSLSVWASACFANCSSNTLTCNRSLCRTNWCNSFCCSIASSFRLTRAAITTRQKNV